MKSLALLVLALPLAAQLQVFTLPGTAQVPAGPSVNLGSIAARDSAEFHFRALNAGPASLPLQTLTVNGVAFSLAIPFRPVTLAPGQSYDFSVRFAPAAAGSYSASLTVQTFTTLLRAAAVPGPSLFIAAGQQVTELTGSSLQVNVASGQTLRIALSLGNPYPGPIVIDAISLFGAGFSLPEPLPVPLTIDPSQTLPLPVAFTAGAEGDVSAILTIGPRRFTIVASVFRAQLSPPRIVPGEAAPRNGQQLKLRLQLAQPALAPGSGTLRATFTGAVDDPAVVFPNGLREIKFEVAAGSRDATFGGAPETVIQTGTTAGSLRLDAIAETGMVTETYRFERGPVVVDEAVARRNGSALEIDIAGFDNTRGAGSLNFRFFDRAGNLLGAPIATAPADQFKAYFEQSKLGGVFRLRASFPVTGDATIVGSALVEIANAVGRTELQRLTFP